MVFHPQNMGNQCVHLPELRAARPNFIPPASGPIAISRWLLVISRLSGDEPAAFQKQKKEVVMLLKEQIYALSSSPPEASLLQQGERQGGGRGDKKNNLKETLSWKNQPTK
jgi:hypothetical protein